MILIVKEDGHTTQISHIKKDKFGQVLMSSAFHLRVGTAVDQARFNRIGKTIREL